MFQSKAWESPYKKFLDKWQLGDVTREDYYSWAEWIEANYEKPDSKLSDLQSLCLSDINDENFCKQANPLILLICKNYDIQTPTHDFADRSYGIDVTDQSYKNFIASVRDEQLQFIAMQDYGHDANARFTELKLILNEQNGKIDFPSKSYVDEVISLACNGCKADYETAYCLCILLICRNILFNNAWNFSIESYQTYINRTIKKLTDADLIETLQIHRHYATRLENAQRSIDIDYLYAY